MNRVAAERSPSSPLSLWRTASWAVQGSAVVLLAQALVLLILVRVGGASTAGTYSLALALTAPPMLLFFGQLRAVEATDVAQQHSFRTYLFTRTAMLAAAMAIILGVVMWRRDTAHIAAVTLLVGAMKSVEGLSDIALGAFQRAERMDIFALSQSLRSLLLLGVMGIGLWSTGSLVVSTLAATLAWIAVLLLHDLPRVRGLPRGRDVEDDAPVRPRSGGGALDLVRAAIPLGFVSMLISLRSTVPVYALEHSGGTAIVGVFTAIMSLQLAGTAFVTAIGQSAMARLAAYHQRGDRAAFLRLFWALMAGALATGVGGVLVAIFVGDLALRLLYGPSYGAYQPMLTVVLAGSALVYAASVLGVAITACQAFRVQVPMLLSALIATIAASYVLVPRFGVVGAAWAHLGSAAIWVIIASAVVFMLMSRMRRGRAVT